MGIQEVIDSGYSINKVLRKLRERGLTNDHQQPHPVLLNCCKLVRFVPNALVVSYRHPPISTDKP